MQEEVWEALEATAINKKDGAGFSSTRANASKYEVINHKNLLLRFLGELDDSMSVRDVIEALENYSGDE